jgi:hypothetical protein
LFSEPIAFFEMNQEEDKFDVSNKFQGNYLLLSKNHFNLELIPQKNKQISLEDIKFYGKYNNTKEMIPGKKFNNFKKL